MNSENNKKYLISVAVGPVQDFIASARRSRDLWFGSWLLSELSKTVAETIGEKNLIFPSNLDGNVVNKILAILPTIEENFDAKLRTAIEVRLDNIYKKPIFDEIEKKLGRDKGIFYRTKAEDQIKDMTELYWAAIPFDEDNDDYKICRERVEMLLNARKSTRNFSPSTPWADTVPKSSLDGLRESVIDDKKIDDVRIQKIFGLRKKERLCGVGVLKRLAEKGTDNRFFSTSHVASLPLLSTLEKNEKTEKAVKTYITELTKLIFEIKDTDLGRVPKHLEHEVFGKYDGHLLFENRLIDLPFENEKKQLSQAKKALKEFKNAAFGKETVKPLPYYALLLADGDRMGTVIDNQENKEDHKKLSKALSDFAGNCKKIVEENNGCLIYSGGDDVLAFLPLHTILDCAKELSIAFAEKLSANPKFVDKENNHPTLSVGVAIYHHTEPLQDALATMRRAEKEAKSVKGKNALAIILSKRSGVDTTIKGSWKKDRETEKSFDERLKWFIQLHLDDALPDGVAYELRDLCLRFQDLEKRTVLPGYEKLLKAETIRILKRKKSEGGKKDIDEKVFKDLETFIEKISLTDKGEEKAKWTLEDLANEIIVARDFARAYKQANKKAIKGEAE